MKELMENAIFNNVKVMSQQTRMASDQSSTTLRPSYYFFSST